MNWLISVKSRFTLARLKTSYVGLAFLLLYGLHLIGIFYTSSENMDFGLFDLEVKLSFLVLPVFLLTGTRLKEMELRHVLKAFVLGLAIAGLWHIIRGGIAVNYTVSGERFTTPLHPGYFGMYFNLGIVIAYLSYKNNMLKSKLRAILFGIATLVFIAIVFLTKSKAATITTVLILTFVVIREIVLLRGAWRRTIAILMVLITGYLTWTAIRDTHAVYRMRIMFRQLSEKEVDTKAASSTFSRILAWDSALDLISENLPFGVGTEDVKAELTNYYKKHGYSGVYQKKLNVHNQFLQFTLTLGIFGFLAYLAIFAALIKSYFQSKKLVIPAFILITVVYAMTESMLEVQAGVVFFTFFAILLSQFNNQHS